MSGYLEVKYPFKSNLGLNPFKVSFMMNVHCLSWVHMVMIVYYWHLAVVEKTMVYTTAKPDVCGWRVARGVLQRGRGARGHGGVTVGLRSP